MMQHRGLRQPRCLGPWFGYGYIFGTFALFWLALLATGCRNNGTGIDDDAGIWGGQDTSQADSSTNDGVIRIPPGCRPSAEVCDGVDNSCDGIVDGTPEGPLRRMCYDGPPQTLKVGICRTGWQTCSNGVWGECKEQILPQPEVCDGIDNDCDGVIDGPTVDSGGHCGPHTNLGRCRFGTLTCVDGALECMGAIYPEPEVCDGTDNNCNGIIDEGCECIVGRSEPCGNRFGICATGRRICQSDGTWGECLGETAPQPEVCDGLDNNCNGLVDEGTDELCYPGNPQDLIASGACRPGMRICSDGVLGPCEGYVLPAEEVCNGIDDNCNGIIDDGFLNPGKVDVVLAMDISGSMHPYIRACTESARRFSAEYSGSPMYSFSLLSFPSAPPEQEIVVEMDFGDVDDLALALDPLTATGGWAEQSLDLVMDVADPSNPLGLSWREDSMRVLIMFTDEPDQSYRNPRVTPTQAGEFANQEGLVVYVLAHPRFEGNFGEVCSLAEGQLLELSGDEDQMESQLRAIFDDICPTAPEQ